MAYVRMAFILSPEVNKIVGGQRTQMLNSNSFKELFFDIELQRDNRFDSLLDRGGVVLPGIRNVRRMEGRDLEHSLRS